MKLLIGIGMFGSVIAAALPAQAFMADDPESARIECELTGECGGDAAPAAAATEEAAPARGAPRTSATRGFTFQRATPQGAARAAKPVAREAAVASSPSPIRAADLKLTFLPNSAALTEGAKARLAKYAAVLASPKLASRRMRIEGHTDATGSARINLELSRRRAQAVADFLTASGVDARRVEVVGYGSSQPLAGMAPQAAANRRVMAVLL